jgi:hypothetical protein
MEEEAMVVLQMAEEVIHPTEVHHLMAGEAIHLTGEVRHRVADEAILAGKATLHPVVAEAVHPAVDVAAQMEEEVRRAAEDKDRGPWFG